MFLLCSSINIIWAHNKSRWRETSNNKIEITALIQELKEKKRLYKIVPKYDISEKY